MKRRATFLARSTVALTLAVSTVIGVGTPAFAGKPGGGGTSGSPGLNATINAWDRSKSPGTWGKGNTSGYAELQTIPFRLAIAGGPSDQTISSLETDFDHANSGVPGIADLVTTPGLANQSFTPGASPTHNFAICGASADAPVPPTGTGAAGPCSNVPWVPVGGSQSCQPSLTSATPPTDGSAYVQGPYCTPISGGVIEGSYVWHNIVMPANSKKTIVWGALLALGSHAYNGSSLHGSIGPVVVSPDNSISFGAKDVPIPVNQIIALETDKKVNGSDGPVPLTIGQTATVSITAKAFGPNGLTQNITIDDTLPPCLAYNGSPSRTPTSAPPIGSSGHVIFGPIPVSSGNSTTVSFSIKAVAVDPNCANTEVTSSDKAPSVPDTVPTPVGGLSNLTITKDCGAASPTPGSSATHTIDFANSGTASASNVTITDSYTNGLTISNVTETLNGSSVTLTASNYSQSGSTLTFAVGSGASLPNGGTLAAGDTGEISYTVTYPTTATTDGTQTFSDTASIRTAGTVVHSATCARAITYHPDLTMQKTCSTSVSVGATTSHTLVVTNKATNTAPATNATITDTLPSGESYVANSVKVNGVTLYPSSDPNAGKQTLTIPLGTINPGGSDTVTYSVTITSSNPSGLTDTATVTSAQTDLTPSDNTDSCTSGTTTVDVTVSKACTATAAPGTPITEAITFGNDGNAAATGVSVKDILNSGETPTSVALDTTSNAIWTPGNPGTSVTSSSGPGAGQTTLTFTPSGGAVAAKSSHVLYVTFTVPATATTAGSQTFSDTASISATNETDTTQSNNTSTCGTAVDYEPDLHLAKTSCQATAVSGGELSYTLTFSNSGSAPADPASLVDTLPTYNGQPAVSVGNAHGGTVNPAATTVTWSVGPIPVGGGGSRQLDLIVTSPAHTSLINSASLTSGSNTTSAVAASVPVTTSATATGGAWSIDASLLGVEVLDHINHVTSSATPGSPSSGAAGVGPLNILGLATVSALTTATTSEVNPTQGPIAIDTSSSQILGLNLLSGLVTADAVRGVSTSEADALGATYGSAGSFIAALKVNGTSITTINPNTTIFVADPTSQLLGIPCDATHTTGCLAKVVIDEEAGHSSLATAGGTNHADHFVNMIDVTLLKSLSPLAAAGLEITVGHAESTADYASGYACGVSLPRVKGRAFTGFVQGTLGSTVVATGIVGDANLPPTGGSATSSTVLTVPSIVSAGAATNATSGALTPFPNATASSSVTNPTLTIPGLTIHADALQEESTSVNGGTSTTPPCNGSINTCYRAVFANLTINGASLPQLTCPLPLGPNPATANPAGVNCTIAIPQPDGSIIEVVVNEQVPAAGQPQGQANAVHVYVLKGGFITAEVILTHAESGAFTS